VTLSTNHGSQDTAAWLQINSDDQSDEIWAVDTRGNLYHNSAGQSFDQLSYETTLPLHLRKMAQGQSNLYFLSNQGDLFSSTRSVPYNFQPIGHTKFKDITVVPEAQIDGVAIEDYSPMPLPQRKADR
jgi:hypothetical protein